MESIVRAQFTHCAGVCCLGLLNKNGLKGKWVSFTHWDASFINKSKKSKYPPGNVLSRAETFFKFDRGRNAYKNGLALPTGMHLLLTNPKNPSTLREVC